jgi:hypothetical protein
VNINLQTSPVCKFSRKMFCSRSSPWIRRKLSSSQEVQRS